MATAPEILRLQINKAGAWKNVCRLRPDQTDEVMRAAGVLARIIGPRPTWRITNEAGAAVVDDRAIRNAKPLNEDPEA